VETVRPVPLTETLDRPRAPAAAARPLSRRVEARWRFAALSLDCALLLLAWAVAATGTSRGFSALPAVWALPFFAVALLALARRGAYTFPFQPRALEDVRAVGVSVTVAFVGVLAASALLEQSTMRSDELIRVWLFAFAYVAAGRLALASWCGHERRAGEGLVPTVIVGAGRVGRLTARRLAERPEFGLQPVGFLDKEPFLATPDEAENGSDEELPVLGASWDLEQVVSRYGVGHVIIAFSTAPHEVLLDLVDRCDRLGVHVSFVPRLFEKVTRRLEVQHIGGLPLVSTRRLDPSGLYFSVKYVLDRVVAAGLILLLSPILVAAVVGVWISMGRPIFFRQLRIGAGGVPFEMLKFRSMREPKADWALFADLTPGLAPGGVEGDDRRTRVGRILRQTSIDELPQLFNVLRGEMSLVGPRPERPEFVRRFDDSVHRYGDRHRVKAGITGWAQVNGLRGKTSIADRAEWDNYYIENFSFWLDLKILALTAIAVFSSFRAVE
jgi:exopolysaccharide biosynthesis polyprenyl glycosylphosphotransferase